MKMAFIIGCCILSYSSVSAQAPQIPNIKVEHTNSPNYEKATLRFLNAIPASVKYKSDKYEEGRYWLILWNFLNATMTAWIFLYGGLSARLKQFSYNLSSPKQQEVVYFILVLSMIYLISLPIDIYENFIRVKEYGIMQQSFLTWLLQDLVRFLVGMIVLIPFLSFFYHPKRSATNKVRLVTVRTVMVYISIFSLTAILFFLPSYIGPIFGLTYKSNNHRLNALQVSSIRFDKQTSELFTSDEIKSKEANERGHFEIVSILKYLGSLVLIVVPGIWIIRRIADKLIAANEERWCISNIGQAGSLPLVVFLVSGFLFICTPVSNSIKRNFEKDAAKNGLHCTREPDANASYQLKNLQLEKIAPGYWEQVIFYDHPSLESMIHLSMKWKRENFIFLPHFSIGYFKC